MNSGLSISSDSNKDDDDGDEFSNIPRLRKLKKGARRAEKEAVRLRVQKQALKTENGRLGTAFSMLRETFKEFCATCKEAADEICEFQIGDEQEEDGRDEEEFTSSSESETDMVDARKQRGERSSNTTKRLRLDSELGNWTRDRRLARQSCRELGIANRQLQAKNTFLLGRLKLVQVLNSSLCPYCADRLEEVINHPLEDEENEEEDEMRSDRDEEEEESGGRQREKGGRENHRYGDRGDKISEKNKPFYKCPHPECSYAGNTPTHVKLHYRTHTGEKPHKCPRCDKAFSRRDHLVAHLHTHTGKKPYKCKFCGRGFADASSRNQHERTHTNHRPYACQFCGREFANAGNKTKHERIHTNQRPYVCSHCDKSFCLRTGLTVHLRTHTDLKPFKCQFCGRGFNQDANKNRHERKIHINAEEEV